MTLFLIVAVPAAAAVLSSSSTVNMVRYFLKTPTGELPPDAIPDFLDVDPSRLPAKLREPYDAKRRELLALKNISDGKSKPYLRLSDEEPKRDCPGPQRMKNPELLLQAGFIEIQEHEEKRVMVDTRCTECELQSEFTLNIVETAPKKGRPPELRYFIQSNDPLAVLVGGYRSGVAPSSSPFGIGGSPKCR